MKRIALLSFFSVIFFSTALLAQSESSEGGFLGAREYTIVDSLLYVGSGFGIQVQKIEDFSTGFYRDNDEYLRIGLIGIPMFPDQRITSVSDSLDGYVYYSGVNSFLAKVEISGATFNNENGSLQNGFDYSIVQFPFSSDIFDIEISEQRILISGENGLVAYSDDNGESWSRATTAVTTSLTNIHVDYTNLFITGDDGTILISYDNGESWSKTEVQESADITDLDIISENGRGYATGLNGVLLYTDNGGLLWQTLTNFSRNVNLYSVDFKDSNFGYIGGESGYSLFTNNGGNIWSSAYLGFDSNDILHINVKDENIIEFSTEENVYLNIEHKIIEQLIYDSMVEAWNMMHNEFNTALLVTADWSTASWGNFGMYDLGIEPRKVFNNSENWNYYRDFEELWNVAYTALTKIKMAKSVLMESSQMPEEQEQFLALANFVEGVVYGQLGLNFDKAQVYLEDVSGSSKIRTSADEKMIFTPTNVFQDITLQEPEKKVESGKYIPNVVFGTVSSKQKTKTSSLFVPYEDVISIALEKLQDSKTLLSNEVPFSFLNTTEDLESEEFEQLINSLMAELVVFKARNSTENSATDWNKVLELTANPIQDDILPQGDDDIWYSFLTIYTSLSGWGRVDQKVISLLDESQPDRWPEDGSTLPQITTEDDRFTSYFEYAGENNFQADRGLYFFSNYRFSRDDSYLDSWTGDMHFMFKTSSDLLRAEALIRTGGSKSEAADLINLTRFNKGGLAEIDENQTDEEFLDAIYYEWMIEIGPYGYGPLAWFNNRRFDELQEGTITQLPVPAAVLKEAGLEVYTFGGTGENPGADKPFEVLLDNGSTVSVQPEFKWTSFEGADKYKLEIRLSNEFGDSVLFVNNLTDTTYSLAQNDQQLEFLSQYSVGVLALDSEGQELERTAFLIIFTSNKVTDAPDLVNPINGADNIYNRVSLFWNVDIGESDIFQYEFSHHIQISEQQDFSSESFIDTVISTRRNSNDLTVYSYNFSVNGLNPETEYFWRVSTINSGGESAWSEVFSFTTNSESMEGMLSAVSPIADQIVNEYPVEFSWTPQAEATSYDLQISNTLDFQKSIFVSETGATTIKVEEIEPGRTYYWRVRAHLAESTGEWVPVQVFSTKVPVPAPPTWEPSNGEYITSENIIFTWDESEYAESYNLQVSTDLGFNTVIHDLTGVTEPTYQVETMESGVYYWRVSATNESGTSEWSEPRNFTTQITSLESGESAVPLTYELSQNYPNPFNPSTQIRFGIPKTSEVSLDVYNLLGQKVASIVNGRLNAGYHTVTFNASVLSSGVYIYTLRAENFLENRKFTLIK